MPAARCLDRAGRPAGKAASGIAALRARPFQAPCGRRGWTAPVAPGYPITFWKQTDPVSLYPSFP